nr:D-alanyl-D-alanine dipeptidase [Raoultella sp. NCTC 9187]
MPIALGSNHSRGTAIDVTLLDESGQPLDMGTAFDEMDDLSHPYHPAVPPAAQRHRLLLNAVMFGGGLRVFPRNGGTSNYRTRPVIRSLMMFLPAWLPLRLTE